jgi:hypothetical protein
MAGTSEQVGQLREWIEGERKREQGEREATQLQIHPPEPVRGRKLTECMMSKHPSM